MLFGLFKPQVDFSYRKAQAARSRARFQAGPRTSPSRCTLPWHEQFTNTVPPTRALSRDAPERAKSVSGAGNTDFTYRTLSQYLKYTLSKNSQQILPRLEPVCGSDLKCQQRNESERRPEDCGAALDVISQEQRWTN